MAYLTPDLVQKALSISSSYKKGGMVAAFQRGGSVDDDEPGDFMGGADEARASSPSSDTDSDDPSGLGDLAREAEEATRGMSDEEREFAAEVAIEAMDRESGGDRDEQERAITRLFEEETLKATQDNIAAMQGDAEAQARIDKITGAPTAAEALTAARGQTDPAKEQALLAAAALDAAERAARTTAPEPQETVTGKVIEQAVSEPIEFFDPRISAGIMSDSPQQFDVEQMRLANDLIARSTPAANQTPVTLDRPLQTDRSGYFRSGEYEVAPSAPTQPLQPQPPAAPAGIEQVAPGIDIQGEIDRFTAPVGVPSVNVPEGFSPREQLESRLGQFDIQQPEQKEMIDLPGPYGRVASGVLNAVFNPTEDTRRAIAAGADPIFADDGSGNIVGAYDAERGITYGIADERFNFRDMDENLRAAFEKSRLRREEERGRDGRDDDELILPEDVAIEEEPAPERPPTIDIIPFRPEDFYYFQQQPFSYTRQGLPSMMNMRTR